MDPRGTREMLAAHQEGAHRQRRRRRLDGLRHRPDQRPRIREPRPRLLGQAAIDYLRQPRRDAGRHIQHRRRGLRDMQRQQRRVRRGVERQTP